MAIYPDLDCIQLYSMMRKIKKENNNTLKDLSMNQILDQVFELKGNYFFRIQKGEVAIILKGKIEKFEKIDNESFLYERMIQFFLFRTS